MRLTLGASALLLFFSFFSISSRATEKIEFIGLTQHERHTVQVVASSEAAEGRGGIEIKLPTVPAQARVTGVIYLHDETPGQSPNKTPHAVQLRFNYSPKDKAWVGTLDLGDVKHPLISGNRIVSREQLFLVVNNRSLRFPNKITSHSQFAQLAVAHLFAGSVSDCGLLLIQ